MKLKAFFIIFKGFSVIKNCLKPQSAPLRKTEIKLGLLTKIDMLLRLLLAQKIIFLKYLELESHNYIPGVVMPSKDIKILELNQYRKAGQTPQIIHADLESLIKKSRWF